MIEETKEKLTSKSVVDPLTTSKSVAYRSRAKDNAVFIVPWQQQTA